MTALVMELVEGPTLADGLRTAPSRSTRRCRSRRQIAEALEAAHEHGHHPSRSEAGQHQGPPGRHGQSAGLRPGEGDGTRSAGAPNVSQSPTITTPAMTHAGMILGTAAYMSPEQARGRPVDKRTDIWAFGCVLYEMLTGARAFEGETCPTRSRPFCAASRTGRRSRLSTPTPIRRLLCRCLEKDRMRRLADAADARLEIEDTLTPLAGEPPSSRSAASRARPAGALTWLSRACWRQPRLWRARGRGTGRDRQRLR